MQVYIPKEVTVVELESAPFKNAREALKWQSRTASSV